jgi:hypothetical protein
LLGSRLDRGPVPAGTIDHGLRLPAKRHFAIRVSSCPSIKWTREKSGDAKKDIQVVVTGHIIFRPALYPERVEFLADRFASVTEQLPGQETSRQDAKT